MRIDGWRIEGFGIFRDWEVRGLSAGLTLFLGPNEAGKSTLLGFLRSALFGFPRRGRAPQYPPLLGGRHGGWLYLRNGAGEFTVERVRRNGLRVNGLESNGDDLRELLGGADENVFCSVFAFGLSEMESFEWIKAEQVRERIFSAGIAGAGVSARRVIELLDDEAAALLRTRGASRIKDLLEQIAQAERRWKAAQEEAERYAGLEQEQEQWRARAGELGAAEQELRLELRTLEAWLDGWESRERAMQRLAALGGADCFPPRPEATLANMKAALTAARSAVRRLEQEQSTRERIREPLAANLDARLAGLADRVEEFHSLLALHRERLKTLADLRPERAQRAGRAHLLAWIPMACAAFGAGWLTANGEAAGGLAILFAGLFTAGILHYRRVTGVERWAARLARLEQEVAGWEQPVREWTLSAAAGERLIPEFVDLRERCRKDRDSRARIAALDEASAGSESELAAARSEVSAAEASLQEFLAASGAADEAGFEERLRAFHERQELAAVIDDLEKRMAPGGGALDANAIEEWRRQAAGLRARLSETQALRDQAIGEQRLAGDAMRRIAESTAALSIKAELECLRTELAAARREWRVAKLARDLVGRTLQEFTRTRQPAVLEEASLAFARITAGAYQRILQDEDGESLVICDPQGLRKRPEELSRGAAEQLYLCLRLALAAEFGRRTAPLPLVMDDVLVNFDPERARAVACELIRFSREHQVLIFTCHPETARLFAETAPETAVVRMERQKQVNA
ncbi:MAG TPA: AAA family ATPase [Bryobacteraceae bacterium]|nr:AAA family ATPase [Bryobacteraceae bacterium]